MRNINGVPPEKRAYLLTKLLGQKEASDYAFDMFMNANRESNAEAYWNTTHTKIFGMWGK